MATKWITIKLQNNTWIRLSEYVCFQFATKLWLWSSSCNVIWKNVPEFRSSRNERSFPDRNKARSTDNELIGWPETTPRRYVGDATMHVEEISRSSDVYSMMASLNLIRSGTRRKWKLARVSVMWAERRRPAINRAEALSTDCRSMCELARYDQIT